MNVDILWSNFLAQIKEQLSSLAYNTWFSETELYKLEDGKAYIIVPMPIHKKHLIENFSTIMSEKLNAITGSNYELILLLKEEIDIEIPKTTEIVEKVGEEPFKMKIQSNLKSKYTFENFIIGNSNKFAHAAALSVAENPGNMYNPLFIYGNSGLGKTHLMHAIGNYIVDNSNKTVLYVTSDNFIQDFIGMSKKDEHGSNFNYVDFFKNKYRNIDVLIIDDIQFLGGATQTQQEFFHTFNNLYNDSKQIIISSDRSPADLKLLEDRLRTRFRWGLTANIFPPDFDLRCKILKDKMSGHEVAKLVKNEVIEYIPNNCESDVRHLEGAITRLYAYAAMYSPTEINLEFATEALRDYLSKSVYSTNNIVKIQKAVADYFNITVENLKSKKRTANINNARQIAIYICRMTTEETTTRIGLEFGNRDHSTVLHAIEKVSKDIKNDEELKNQISEIKEKIS